MKRWLLILGIVVIFILVAIWVFLLFASDKTKEDIYNQFGFSGNSEDGVFENIIDIVLPDLEEEKPALRQLTTKRVAGYAEVALASSSPQIYFAESGTGHIYSLNLTSGQEDRISSITVAGATDAKISKNGTFALIQSSSNLGAPLTVVLISSSTDSFTIDEPVLSFNITDDDELIYSIAEGVWTIGKTYDITTRSARTLFTIPFRQATVLWSNTPAHPHAVMPKTARTLEGYLYTVEDQTLRRFPISGFGLSVLMSQTHTLYTEVTNDTYNSYVMNNGSESVTDLDLPFFPEKCTISTSSGIAYCAHGEGVENPFFPDSWYRGEISFIDSIWSIDLDTFETNSLIDALAVSGRELDMYDLKLSSDEMSLFFKNKNDHTLWLFDIANELNP